MGDIKERKIWKRVSELLYAWEIWKKILAWTRKKVSEFHGRD